MPIRGLAEQGELVLDSVTDSSQVSERGIYFHSCVFLLSQPSLQELH